MALQRLRESAERAKIELSTLMQTEINLPFITADASGPKHLVETLQRSTMEQLVDDLVKKTIVPCKKAMEDSAVSKGEIAELRKVRLLDIETFDRDSRNIHGGKGVASYALKSITKHVLPWYEKYSRPS